MRAAVIEGDISLFGARQHNPLVANAQQLHLIDFQVVTFGDEQRPPLCDATVSSRHLPAFAYR